MVMLKVKDGFFGVFDSYGKVRCYAEPECAAFVLGNFVYRRIFNFCNACKALKFFVGINEKVIFYRGRNPDPSGCVAI